MVFFFWPSPSCLFRLFFSFSASSLLVVFVVRKTIIMSEPVCVASAPQVGDVDTAALYNEIGTTEKRQAVKQEGVAVKTERVALKTEQKALKKEGKALKKEEKALKKEGKVLKKESKELKKQGKKEEKALRKSEDADGTRGIVESESEESTDDEAKEEKKAKKRALKESKNIEKIQKKMREIDYKIEKLLLEKAKMETEVAILVAAGPVEDSMEPEEMECSTGGGEE